MCQTMHYIVSRRFTIIVCCISQEKFALFNTFFIEGHINVHFEFHNFQSIVVVLFSGYKLQGLYDSINWTDFHSLLLKMDQFVKRFSLGYLIL